MSDETEMVSVPRGLLEKALKADASQGATAMDLHHGWLAMKVLRHALNQELAAPAEDVRAEVDEQDLFESVFPMPPHTMRFQGGYAAMEFNAWFAHDFVKKWDGWKARARLNK